MIIIAKLLLAICILAILFLLFPLIQVSGDSMLPTLKDNQLLLGCVLFKLKKGEIYVYKSPVDEKIVIKRLKNFDGEHCFFVGDNKRVSVDSRKYGLVPKKNIIAKVLFVGGKKNEF